MTLRRSLVLLAALGGLAGCGVGPDRLVGERCTSNSDCRDTCATGAEYPGGFCTTSCINDGDCPAGTVCTTELGGICLFECDSDFYCADLLENAAYQCRDHDTPDARVVLACRG